MVGRALKFFAIAILLLLFVALAVATFLAYREAETSEYQAKYLAGLAKELTWEIKSQPDGGLRLPQAGPYDIRLGYNRQPEWLASLTQQGFQVKSQAHVSLRMKELVAQGLFVPYREKNQAGLELFDGSGEQLYRGAFPARVYRDFQSVPRLLVTTLLFIEDRELLDPDHPGKNPAVNWRRLGKALQDKVIQIFQPAHDVPGGSTLATQIEKYRHSPDGVTLTAKDKLQQIVSASVRAYLDGEENLSARQRIVVDYLNTVPLAAVPGFGEANGIGDGLWAWYGLDFDEVNKTLKDHDAGMKDVAAAAKLYKHVLSLMIAQRRPSGYLVSERKALEALTNSHLRVLAQAGVIRPDIRDAALNTPLQFRTEAIVETSRDFAEKKAVNAVRVQLASMLGLKRLYDLDRLDLSVQSTLDNNFQKKVTEILRQLGNPEYARAAGLYGERLLGTADPGKIIYSLTLAELTPRGVKFRIQADNFDQPLDINQGTKLDLGSTAKLRTLVTYLEIFEALHRKYADWTPEALREESLDPKDALARWAVEYFLNNKDKSLAAMLDAALERQYSASPAEQFFTGGGVQVFHNFKGEDDGRVMSVREATRHSVNLVYIRMMRDIVRYYMLHIPGSSARILAEKSDPKREAYLKRFADREGQVFMNRFYSKYKGKTAGQISEVFFSSFRHTPNRLAAAYRYVYPEATPAQFGKFMLLRLPGLNESGSTRLDSLYARYAPGKFSLEDQGYVASVHPLELWLVRYLITHPQADYKDMIEASAGQRVAVYGWLFRTKHKNAQDSRIRSLLELEAFLEIHQKWKRLGYPFNSLVPSLGTAIGSSADRPAALTELMGIILNDGVRLPRVLIEKMHFAKGTPFEAMLEHAPRQGEKLFSPELAAAVRGLLTEVVEKGTAARLSRAIIKEDGTWIQIGGKTGTGDHRHVTFSAPGVIRESRAVNRSATFVFFIGDRYFGNLTAFVPGAQADKYQFTSALSTQVLKHLLPALKPLTDQARPLLGNTPLLPATEKTTPRLDLRENEAEGVL